MQKSVLVVEDSETDAFFLTTTLEKAGYTVMRAYDGQQAEAMAQQYQPSAIIMDIVMPQVDGFSATRSITANKQTCHIPIIIYTSKKGRHDKEWAIMQGARCLLVKDAANARKIVKTVDSLI